MLAHSRVVSPSSMKPRVPDATVDATDLGSAGVAGGATR